MEKIVGCCGLVCTTCPIYVATRENNNKKRKEISEIIERDYHRKVTLVQVNCDGCSLDDSRIFIGGRDCKIRKCCNEKTLPNCGHCGEYVCEKLREFSEFSLACRETLDEIKQGAVKE